MRLTNDIKAGIRESVLLHRFGKRLTDLCKERKAVAIALWEKHMTRKGLAQLTMVPKGWLPTKTTIHVKLIGDGKWYQMNFSGMPYWVGGITPQGWKAPESVWKEWPFNLPDTYAIEDGDEAFNAEVEAIISVTNDLMKEIKEARDALGVIDNFTTSEKLIAAWPELESFVTAALPPPKAPLPALQTDRLNALFDLPPEETADA